MSGLLLLRSVRATRVSNAIRKRRSTLVFVLRSSVHVTDEHNNEVYRMTVIRHWIAYRKDASAPAVVFYEDRLRRDSP